MIDQTEPPGVAPTFWRRVLRFPVSQMVVAILFIAIPRPRYGAAARGRGGVLPPNPGAQLIIYPGVGHDIIEEAPAVSERDAEEFLARAARAMSDGPADRGVLRTR
jgi:pimeloyl-ACP methyl ester carboxylesterase